MIRTRIYKGDSAGGPIDYATPIGDVAGTSYSYANLPLNSTTRFGIRNYDDISWLEEANVDATVTVVVDGQGQDASDVPGQPTAVVASASGAASVVVAWQYYPITGRSDPTLFNVYMTQGPEVDWTAPPVASVAMREWARDFRATLDGIQSGLEYAFGVRSVRGAATDGNTFSFVIPLLPPAPLPVADLAGTLTFTE